MGAHPSAPSGVALPGGGHTTLDAMIAADPVASSARECVARFGGRLPFLLKVLAARRRSLSRCIRRGCRPRPGSGRRTSAASPRATSPTTTPTTGPSRRSSARSPVRGAGRDARPAGRGRAAERARGRRARPDQPRSWPAAAAPEALTEALAAILAWPSERRPALVAEVAAGCAVVAAGGGPYAAACAAAVRLSREHPGDLGVVASLLLRHSVLRPGQAIFLPAGGLHAYLHGTGVELLANSDNVVRAGLTAKHIDVPELLKLTDPAVAVPVLEPRRARRRPVRLRLARAGVPAVPGRARRRRDQPAGGGRRQDRALRRGRGAAPGRGGAAGPGRRPHGRPGRVVLRRRRGRRGHRGRTRDGVHRRQRTRPDAVGLVTAGRA